MHSPRATSAMTRLVEEVGYPSAVDIRTEFTQILTDIEAEMSDVLERARRPRAAAVRDARLPPRPRRHAPDRGGKRIRPLLGLLAYQSLGRRLSQGAARAPRRVELGHNFSLVHDDIEDADRERRHRPTLWAHLGRAARHQRRRRALRAEPPRAVSAPRRRGLQRPPRARPHEDLRRDVPRAVRGPVPRHQLRAPRRRHASRRTSR